MSELKAFDIVVAEEGYCEGIVKYRRAVYDKYEADKVIAYHKYKRCLAMAYVEWLKQMILCNYPESILYRMAIKRERKWKELPEKFKAAK